MLRRQVGVRVSVLRRYYADITPDPKKSLWDKVKHEAQHYWHGTKLLGLEIKISSKLLFKMAAGYELTRREDLQFRRTSQDMIRLVPFSAFVIIPFAELLLPVALKLFPNMLPSTYESAKDKETKVAALRKTRGVVAEILRDAKSRNHFQPTAMSDEQKSVFHDFYKAVRASGKPESREQLIAVARLFTDDTVLDNFTRPHLVAMAKYINLQPFGTDNMLRYRIRYQMLQIKKDDIVISYEGVNSLNLDELKSACASRGIKLEGANEATLRENLSVWLNMRLKDKIPSTLLVMSAAFTYGDLTSNASLYEALTNVLAGVPDELYHEVKLQVVEADATNMQRIVHLKEQEEIMKDEVEQEKHTVLKVKDDIKLDAIENVDTSTKTESK